MSVLSPTLSAVLARVPSALFAGCNGAPPAPILSALGCLLTPPCLPPPFPALRSVAFLAPYRHLNDGDAYPFSSIVAGLCRCPHLQNLHLSLLCIPSSALCPVLSQLLCLSSLRTLRLTADLTMDDLLLLLSVPLTTLDLQASTVNISTPPPSPFPPLPSLQTLLLPVLSDAGIIEPLLSTPWEQALLTSLSTPLAEGAQVGLERLLGSSIQASSLSYIPLFRRLHTLQLSVFGAAEKDEVDALYDLCTSLTTASLPLRHLHLQNGVMQRLFTAMPPLVSAYAGQLCTLELPYGHCDENNDGVAPQPSAAAADAMTAALLSCHSLRRLQVASWWLAPSASPPATASSPALPHLQSLHLDDASSIDEATLAVLLDQSPHLQELS